MRPVAATPEAVQRLLALPRYATSGSEAMKPGLDRIRALLATMSNPERTFDTVLVAGTNGKGTTAAMIASVLGATGMRVGLHTSPHLVRVTERMRVDGREATPAWLAHAAQRYWPAIDDTGASFFEATLALSILFFAEQEVDVAVVEVGLGGRLDATNALPAVVSVITHIGLDHMEILGHTLAAIATEKAGIAKRGQPLVVGPLPGEALDAVRRVAERVRAPVILSNTASLPDAFQLPFPGLHMRTNARTALTACRELLGHLPPAHLVCRALEETVARTGLRGRLETVRESPLIMVDVGHNVSAVEAALQAVHPEQISVLVLGMARDKDAEAVGRLLVGRPGGAGGTRPKVWTVGVGVGIDASVDASIHAVPDPRGQTAAALAARLMKSGCAVARTFDTVSEALTETATGTLFMGSHHVVADVFRHVPD